MRAFFENNLLLPNVLKVGNKYHEAKNKTIHVLNKLEIVHKTEHQPRLKY